MYNFVGAWVARKHKEIFGDIQGDPADHPELIQQLKQVVDNDLKIDYLVTGGCMTTNLIPFLCCPRTVERALDIRNGRLICFPRQGHKRRQLRASGSWAQSISTCGLNTDCFHLLSRIALEHMRVVNDLERRVGGMGENGRTTVIY